ncbi:hypothetical protein TWF281_000333 [Arthrobotrys megalospora]
MLFLPLSMSFTPKDHLLSRFICAILAILAGVSQITSASPLAYTTSTASTTTTYTLTSLLAAFTNPATKFTTTSLHTNTIIKVARSTPTPTITTIKNPTPVERVVSPTFFYQGPLKVKCQSPETAWPVMKNYAEHPDAAPPESEIPADKWESSMRNIRAVMKALGGAGHSRIETVIRIAQEGCKECDCDPEGGLIANPSSNQYSGCLNSWQANRCVRLYACYCSTRLGQPQINEENLLTPLQEFQNAINQIPGSVLYDRANANWAWRVDPAIATGPRQILQFDPGYQLGALDTFDNQYYDELLHEEQNRPGPYEFADIFDWEAFYRQGPKGGGSSFRGFYKRENRPLSDGVSQDGYNNRYIKEDRDDTKASREAVDTEDVNQQPPLRLF